MDDVGANGDYVVTRLTRPGGVQTRPRLNDEEWERTFVDV